MTGNERPTSGEAPQRPATTTTSITPAGTSSAIDLDELCDRAITTGRPVAVGAVVVIPDVAELQGAANGLPPLPPGPVRRRADGRSVKVFRAPRGKGWPVGGGQDG